MVIDFSLLGSYKLQYHNSRKSVLSIKWAVDKKDYVAGDCRVRAIKGMTDVKKHNVINSQKHNYSEHMTLDEIRNYILKNSEMLGSQIHDCVGLTLEDVCENVEFDISIQVRN